MTNGFYDMTKLNMKPAVRFYEGRLKQLKAQRRQVRRQVLWLQFKRLFSL